MKKRVPWGRLVGRNNKKHPFLRSIGTFGVIKMLPADVLTIDFRRLDFVG